MHGVAALSVVGSGTLPWGLLLSSTHTPIYVSVTPSCPAATSAGDDTRAMRCIHQNSGWDIHKRRLVERTSHGRGGGDTRSAIAQHPPVSSAAYSAYTRRSSATIDMAKSSEGVNSAASRSGWQWERLKADLAEEYHHPAKFEANCKVLRAFVVFVAGIVVARNFGEALFVS